MMTHHQQDLLHKGWVPQKDSKMKYYSHLCHLCLMTVIILTLIVYKNEYWVPRISNQEY